MKLMSADQIDWEDQRAFLAVLESGSLSGAARRLGVAQPTIRHRLEGLERSLGVALFSRSTNGLVATEQAQALAVHARTMAAASHAFVRAASAPAASLAGTVRLSAAEIVGIEVLPPMLAGLRRCHPELAIELSLTNEAEDVLGQEVDIAIRMHRPRQGALVGRHVGCIPLGFFAHGAYAARRGVPASIADLPEFDLIGPDRSLAELHFAAELNPALDRKGFAFRTDSHPAQLAAIRAGLGIGITHIALGNRDAGLVAVLPDFILHRLETWIVMHEDLKRLARIRIVFDWLVEAFLRYAEPL